MPDLNIIPPRYKRAFNCPECNPLLVTLFTEYTPRVAGKFYRYSKSPLHICPPIQRKPNPPHIETDREYLDRTREERRQATYAFVEAQIAKHRVSRERRLKSQRDRAKLKREKARGTYDILS